jgi:hypothetical protein
MIKKAISPVVAIALILVVAVVAVVSFQTWFGSFQNTVFSDVDLKSSSATTGGGAVLETVSGNTLYIKNTGNENVTIKKIEINGEDCNINENISSGMKEFSVSECLANISTEILDVVVITNDKVLEKSVFRELDSISSSGSNGSVITSFDGNGVWSTTYGDIYPDYADALFVDSSKNVYVTGRYRGDPALINGIDFPQSLSSSYQDFYVSKYDNSGNGTLNITYGSPYNSLSDYSRGIVVDSSGNIYIAGLYPGDPPAQNGLDLAVASDYAVFLLKYDSSGYGVWNVSLDSSGGSDGAYEVALDSSENVYIAGYYSGDPPLSYGIDLPAPNGITDAFVAKYDSNGNGLWSTTLGGSGQSYVYDLHIDSSDNIYITGKYQGDPPLSSGIDLPAATGSWDAYVAKYDSSGSGLWASTFGSTDEENSNGVYADSSGNVYIVGQYRGNPPLSKGIDLPDSLAPGGDIFIVKYDSSGNGIWNRTIRGTGIDDARSVYGDSQDNIYITGYYQDNPVSQDGLDLPNSNGGYDVFVVKYNGSGDGLWNTTLGGSGSDYGYDVFVDSSDDIYIAGFYSNNPAPINGIDLPNVVGSYDYFVAKYE